MKRYTLLVALLIAMLEATACTSGSASQDAGAVSSSPSTEGSQSTALPPTAAVATSIPLPSDTPESATAIELATAIPVPSDTPEPTAVPPEEPTSEPIAASTGASTARVIEITDDNYAAEVLQSP